MNAPLFSIVIPTYNRAASVRKAIDSCLKQTCQDFEIIIVDDEKSTDDMEGTVAEFKDPRIRVIMKHRGRAAAARNKGMQLAKGRYVALLDADDVFLPEKLAVYRDRLRLEPDALLFSQNYVDRGVGRYWIKPNRGLHAGESIFDYLFVDKGWVHPSSLVIRTDLALRHPFREDLSFGDDMQFAVDQWLDGVRISMVEQPLSIYDDPYRPDRLSQSPRFQAGNTPEHNSFMEWVEQLRPRMSERAYLGYRAQFRSRFIVRSNPYGAFQDIFTAYQSNVLSARKCVAQLLQTFVPDTYRHCADLTARLRGRKDFGRTSLGASV